MYCPCGLVTLSPRICANHLCRDNLLLCHSRQSPASPETFAFGSREKLYCKLPTLNQHIDGISTQRAYDSKLTKKKSPPLHTYRIEYCICFCLFGFFDLHCGFVFGACLKKGHQEATSQWRDCVVTPCRLVVKMRWCREPNI
jgi:hypothetical protein